MSAPPRGNDRETRGEPAADVDEAPPVAGTVLSGRYVLESRIGQGGMGWVYRATDVALQRAVAIKILLPGLARVPEVYARFAREARSMAALDHPNIVPVFDVGHEAPWHYFVMKLLDGAPLSDRLAGGPLPVPVAVDLAAQILAGLEHLHDRGLVHRDIKPGNVLVTSEGRAVLLDFGILLTASVATRVTAAGLFVGTPEYVAPEIVQARPGDARSDQYGLGITLYEMLTGLVPFDGGSAIEIAARRLRDAPAPLRAHRPDVPPELEDVVLRALERSPADRFASAREMREALLEAARAYVPAAPVPTLPRHEAARAETEILERPRLARSWARIGAVASAGLVVALAVFALAGRGTLEPTRREGRPPASPQARAVPSGPAAPLAAAPLPGPDVVPPAAAAPAGGPGAQDDAPAPAAPGSVSANVPAPDAEPGLAANAEEPSAPPSARGPRRGAPPAAPPPARPPSAAGHDVAPAAAAKGSLLERARAALRERRHADALRLFQEASRAAPGSAAPLRGLGDAYLAVGNRTAAMAAYRRFLALEPNARDAAAVRARLEALGGR